MTPPAVEPPMAHARLRLILAAALFCGWIGWLAYLALTTTRPVVLSRAQFLASRIDVVAELYEVDGKPAPEVVVKRVVWAADAADKNLADRTVKVSNLPAVTREDGWAGAGGYILPLVKDGDEYQVAPIPLSPGLSERRARPRIYRATPQALAQLREIRPSAPFSHVRD